MAEEFDAGLSWWSTRGSTTSSTATTTSFDDSLLQNPDFDMDWNQTLLTRSTSGRADQPIFNAMLQEPLDYHHHQQQLLHHFGRQNMIMNNSQQLLGLQGGQSEPQQPIFDARSTDCVAGHGAGYHGSSSDSVPKLPEFFKSSSPSFQQSSSGNNSQFSKNTAFWPSVQFGARSYEQKPSCTKLNSDGTQKKNGGGGGGSSSSGQSASKKARIELPSPLPVFKVRKEKLGDRVTALQQLVSPFGKTDTASVLHEAIKYIKFLHEQVGVLTTPYLKNGHPMQGQQREKNKTSKVEGCAWPRLRSRIWWPARRPQTFGRRHLEGRIGREIKKQIRVFFSS